MQQADKNLQMVALIANSLGPIRTEVVFVGGTVAGLLLSFSNRSVVRPTDDVDVVIDCSTYSEYSTIVERLLALGFEHVQHGPLCRFKIHGVTVDVMPTNEKILGFSNKWYPKIMTTATPFTLPDGSEVRIVNAPLFICTKLEAFGDRGNQDYLLSSDLEDIVTIVADRMDLLNECERATDEVKDYLTAHFDRFLSSDDFLNALPGLLPPILVHLEHQVIETMRRIVQLRGSTSD